MEEEEKHKVWQISDFSQIVGKHYTTVNKWFNILEKKRIHYVNRLEASNQKVYDELDLRVAQFITEKTSEGSAWKFEGVVNILEQNPPFDLRPFPIEYSVNEDNDFSVNIEKAIGQVMERVELLLKEESGSILNPLRQETNQIIHSLKSAQIELVNQRQQQTQELITNQRVLSQLRLEALENWDNLPDTEKTIKTGLFKRETDHSKREQFIEKFVIERYEERLQKELKSTNVYTTLAPATIIDPQKS